MLKIIKVTGNSLSPLFLPGDYVIVRTSRSILRSVKTGATVVFDHPDFGRLIKNVHTNHPTSKNMKVIGAHENSISSHKLGPIPYSDLLGKVILHIKKPR